MTHFVPNVQYIMPISCFCIYFYNNEIMGGLLLEVLTDLQWQLVNSSSVSSFFQPLNSFFISKKK